MPNINDANMHALLELARHNQLAQYIDESIIQYYTAGLNTVSEVAENKPTPTFEEYCESERKKECEQEYRKTSGDIYALQLEAANRVHRVDARYIDEPQDEQQEEAQQYIHNHQQMAQRQLNADAAIYRGEIYLDDVPVEPAPRRGVINRIFGG